LYLNGFEFWHHFIWDTGTQSIIFCFTVTYYI